MAADSARRFPANTGLALLHAKALVLTGRYQEAAGLLSSLDLLPSEGVTDARTLFHEAHLMLAVERMRAKAFDQALPLIETARQWPEKLGSGKPYPEDVDERLEDWLVYQCQIGLKAPEAARRALDKILAFQPGGHRNDSGQIIRALALKQSGRIAEGRGAGASLAQARPRQRAGQVGRGRPRRAAGPAPDRAARHQLPGSRRPSAVRECCVADDVRSRQARASDNQVLVPIRMIGHSRRPAFRDRTAWPAASMPASPKPSGTTDPGSGTLTFLTS